MSAYKALKVNDFIVGVSGGPQVGADILHFFFAVWTCQSDLAVSICSRFCPSGSCDRCEVKRILHSVGTDQSWKEIKSWESNAIAALDIQRALLHLNQAPGSWDR